MPNGRLEHSRRWSALAMGAALLACAAGCTGSAAFPGDAGMGVNSPSLCDSQAKATTVAACELTIGSPLSTVAPKGGRYISEQRQLDWYSVQAPSTADARTLLHFSGGYSAPNTAVNFSATVLKQDGVTPIITGADLHGQAPPSVVDLITQFQEGSQTLYVTVSDDPANPQNSQIDLIHPYDFTVDVLEDPDLNEPNNTAAQATPVVLSSGGGGLTGTSQGYISYPGDVDYFVIDVPAGGRQILYLHLDYKDMDLTDTRPANLQLAYTLLTPDGLQLSEGHVANRFETADLATARLVVPAGGKYVVQVQQWQDENTTTTSGDLSYQYDLDVLVIPDVDPNEPNDTVAQAKIVSVGGVGSTGQVKGRLSYVPDLDYYQVNVTGGANTALHYKVTLLTSGGRFPPLPGVGQHQAQLFTVEPDTTTCNTNCPQNPDPTTSSWISAVQSFCQGSAAPVAPPLCLWSSRTENTYFPGLRNMEGVIPVGPGVSSVIFLVQAASNTWADDIDYQVDFDVESVQAQSGTPLSISMAGGYGTTLSGSVAEGYGRLYQYDPTQTPTSGTLPGVRAADDYDAYVASQLFELDIGSVAAPMDQTWQLAWTVPNLPDGGAPFELTVHVQFCTSSGCTADTSYPTDHNLTDVQGNTAVWWMFPNTSQYQNETQPPYTLATSGPSNTVTADPYQCLCIPPSNVAAGKFFLTVYASDKNGYGWGASNVGNYSIQTALAPYPTPASFSFNGGTMSCPAPVMDAGVWQPGCQFYTQG